MLYIDSVVYIWTHWYHSYCNLIFDNYTCDQVRNTEHSIIKMNDQPQAWLRSNTQHRRIKLARRLGFFTFTFICCQLFMWINWLLFMEIQHGPNGINQIQFHRICVIERYYGMRQNNGNKNEDAQQIILVEFGTMPWMAHCTTSTTTTRYILHRLQYRPWGAQWSRWSRRTSGWLQRIAIEELFWTKPNFDKVTS